MNILKEFHPTKDLKDFIKAIIETKSKEEEDNIIRRGIESLKSGIAQKNPSNAKMIEYCLRAIYSDMLGHNVAFSQIFAIKMIESKSIHVKRIGYLASTLMLNQESELKILIVASLQRDLMSKNDMEVTCALNSLNKLVNESFAQAFVPCLTNLFESKNASIKKKTLIAMQKIEHLIPNSIPSFSDKIKQALLELDFTIVNVAVGIILDECQNKKELYVSTIKPLAQILKQVFEKKVLYYDYQKIPEPYLQLKILKIFAILAKNNKQLSEEVSHVVEGCLSRADNLNTDVSFALVYENIITICALYYNKPLLDIASGAVSKFLNPSLSNSNMIYLGITALKHITQIDPSYLQDHQAFVINCIESNDETIKRITLDLLCKNASPVNIEIITSKLTKTLMHTTDYTFKKDLTKKIFDLAVLQASDISWFVKKLNELLLTSADFFSDEMITSTIRIFSEHFSDSFEFGRTLTEETLKLLSTPNPHDTILKIVSWVLGFVSIKVHQDSESLSRFYRTLAHLLTIQVIKEETRVWILDSLQILSRTAEFREKEDLIEKLYKLPQSRNSEVMRKINDITNRKFNKPITDYIHPNFDAKLSFLLNFANLKKGKFYNIETSENIGGYRQTKSHFSELKLKNDEPKIESLQSHVESIGFGVDPKNQKWTISGYQGEKKDHKSNLTPKKQNSDIFAEMDRRFAKPSEELKKKPNPKEVDLFAMGNNVDLFSKTQEKLNPSKNQSSIPVNNNQFSDFDDFIHEKPKQQQILSTGDDLDLFGDINPSHKTSKTAISLDPLKIDEGQYQEFWEEFVPEKKGLLTVKVPIQLFISQKHLALVSEDGDDFITAAKSGSEVVLVYLTRIQNSKFEFIIKAKHPGILEKLSLYILE